MPELPEVQTTINGLQLLVGHTMYSTKIYTPKLRYNIPKNISKLEKLIRILKIYRTGKYIIINLSNLNSLIFHLGMSGRLRILDSNQFIKNKHDHFVIFFKKRLLVFNDQRKFGYIDICDTKEINKKEYIKKLGIDALDDKLNEEYLFNKIKESEVPIKQIMLNQKIISGIGNIYANEILFDSKISPFIKGNSLNIRKLRRLIKSTKKILNKAINSGGSSLKDYVSTDGTLGNFQNNFKVYNREGKKIAGSKIKRVVQYGRSTFYCPSIQIMPKINSQIYPTHKK